MDHQTGIDPVASAEAVRKLRGALDRLGESLAVAQLDGVLAAEADLNDALMSLGSLLSAGALVGRDLRQELDGVRASLVRCRRLGTSLGQFVRVSLDARGADGRYDRFGRDRGEHPAGVMRTSA